MKVGFVTPPWLLDGTQVIGEVEEFQFTVDEDPWRVGPGTRDLVAASLRCTVMTCAGLEARAQVRRGLVDVIEWLHEEGVDA